MAVTDTRMKGWVKLPSDAAYATLKSTGTYTQDGRTITYDDTTAYITPSDGIGGTTLQGNTAVVTNASGEVINSGVTSTELSYVSNARSNIQKQIDDIVAQIGVGTQNYFAATFAEIDYTKPGNWYIENGDGTYFYGIVDNEHKFTPINARVDPSEIGQQDLSAYQLKQDAAINVRAVNGVPQGTVVNAINAIEVKAGNAWPLATTAQTLSGAINELYNSGGTDVTVTGINGISVTNVASGKFAVGHTLDGTKQAATYGQVINPGLVRMPFVTTDANGHVLTSTTATAQNFYIPTTVGTAGQVWTWNATLARGEWQTPTGGGAVYTGNNGIQIDGTVISHVNTGKAFMWSGIGYADKLVIDDSGHVITYERKPGNAGQYLGEYWQFMTPKKSADEILENTDTLKLTTSKSIYDIMGGMRLKKMTQAAYDALATKDPNTVYIIIG